MRWISVPAGEPPPSKKRLRVSVAECAGCGFRDWFVFQLPPSDRVFIQCQHCDLVESADGGASADLEFYALAVAAAEPVIHPLTVPGEEVPQ